MQINQAKPIEIWDWAANVDAAKRLFAEKESAAKKYLERHPPKDDEIAEMLLNESIQRYNGGTYYKWNEDEKKWEARPANDYVSMIRSLMVAKPWPGGSEGAILASGSVYLRIEQTQSISS
jgi:hypothetical protein